jgi:hypothetical protein
MNGLRLLTLEEKNALAVLADAVDYEDARCF